MSIGWVATVKDGKMYIASSKEELEEKIRNNEWTKEFITEQKE